MPEEELRPVARLQGWWLRRGWLPRLQRLTREERQAWVFRTLQQVLVRAGEGSPFYRERFRQAGFDAHRDFRTVADLERLPILTKEEVQAQGERMRDRRFHRWSLEAHTGGSTGQPIGLRLGAQHLAIQEACLIRHRASAGCHPRERLACLHHPGPGHPDGGFWRFSPLRNTLFLYAWHWKPSLAAACLAVLLRFRPAFLHGHGSSLSLLADSAHSRRAELGFVRGIFTTSATLSELERARIEATFGRILFACYAMTEPSVVITERPDHEGMEVNWESGYPEFLADETLAPGERRLVVTSLHNPVMPFIRYDTGDVACLAGRPDETGPAPRLRAMLGRKEECLFTPDGGRLPSPAFQALLQARTDILRFQFIQPDIDRVVLKLSLRPGLREVERLVYAVRDEVARHLGPSLALEVEVTERFLTGSDGRIPTFQRLFGRSPATPSLPLSSELS